MKTILYPIIASVLCGLLPSTARAASTENENHTSDNIEVLSRTIDNPTTAFLSLDEAPEYKIGNAFSSGNEQLASQIIDYASNFLGRPYRRGAKGPSAFDCSGFTSYIFSNFDISLSASSRDQFGQGERISYGEIQPGDLLFFSGHRGGSTVGHVAMATEVKPDGTVKFIHAANKGGIRHDVYPDGGYYSKRFLGARRVIK